MACPGGRVIWGGTSTHTDKKTIEKRIDSIDQNSQFKKSHDNPLIQSLYKGFLGKPGGHVAHDLLHTHYKVRK
jgi:iron only hydrogenase large subunit-like protein